MKLSDKIFYFVCYTFILNPIFYCYGWFFLSSVATLAIVIKSIVDIIKDVYKTFKNKNVKENEKSEVSNKTAKANENI